METTLLLPLGVMANQLQKIEAQLRLVCAGAAAGAAVREAGPDRAVQAELDRIHEALASIAGLVAQLEAGLQPATRKTRPARDD